MKVIGFVNEIIIESQGHRANAKEAGFAACPLRARDETRTHTGFTPLAPETSASTISPPALRLGLQIYNFFRKCKISTEEYR